MRNPLRRYYGSGDLHFVTFSCYRRRQYLGTPGARDRFIQKPGNRWTDGMFTLFLDAEQKLNRGQIIRKRPVCPRFPLSPVSRPGFR